MAQKVRATSIEAVTSNHPGIYYPFTPVPEELLQDNTLSLAERGFLAVLISYSRPQRGRFIIWPGVAKLAEICGCSERKIKRLMQGLEKRGLLTRQRRMGTSSTTELACIAPGGAYSSVVSLVSPTNGSGMACKVDVGEVDVEANGRTADCSLARGARSPASRAAPSKAPLKD